MRRSIPYYSPVIGLTKILILDLMNAVPPITWTSLFQK